MKTVNFLIIVICFKIMMLKHLTDSSLIMIESFKIMMLKHLSDLSFTAVEILKFSVVASNMKFSAVFLIFITASSIIAISHKRKELKTSSMTLIK